MIESSEIAVGEDGRVQLPAGIRARLGLVAGSRLLVDSPNDSEVTLRLALASPEIVEKEGLLVLRGVSAGEILTAETDAREARLIASGSGLEG